MPRPSHLQEPALPLFQAGAPVSGKPAKRPSYIADHRARLRDRFLDGGADAMPDYELLEMVLFRANARRDMKPVGRALLDRFGSFNRVISAPPADLMRIDGVGRSLVAELKLIEAAAQRLMRDRVINRPVLSSWQALLDYCQTAMAHRDTEQFRILFLDRKNVLVADEPQARGTVDHVPVYPREVVKRALELNASALILVHNHPSGDPTPSPADIDMTAQVAAAADALGITVHDHLVIGRATEFSFRAQGYL
ncbi:DNA repair protein [Pseudooceanicola batsensis HTCC2597]|uniref:DNA repair protein n=1 Tax=Pseudooceanicola batsensis (strain ATCC BAA-863 / DSM 15984 / KCTC 12145 / HTCC2597) TaxID=252305 RepID=A3TWC6_PSEBH|nr:DNA repair protein RadC [Pseudooceanicola batsensis]EAQ03922.1 DNA repair protein [Pseudooceanicola batsensis HTCC2597]